MKLNFKSFIIILMLATNYINADTINCNPCDKVKKCENENCDVFGKTYFAYRPQDSNVAQRMVGYIDKKFNREPQDELSGTVSASIAYSQTFKPEKLAKFFSFSGKNPQSYGPTCGEFDIYGINFGTTSTGQICLSPNIRNVVFNIDFQNYWDPYVCNLWTRAYLPLTHTSWDLELKEACGTKFGSNLFPENLVTIDFDTGTDVPFRDLTSAFVGTKVFGSAPALNYGRVINNREVTEVTKLAGFHFEIGYDFYSNENYYFAAGVHVVAPTGNRANAEFLFEPIAGAGHHWQLGATLQGGYNLWQSNCGDHNFTLYFDSVITHLFASHQRRLFGLKIDGKTSPGSSYLLLKKFNQDGNIVGLQRAANLLACDTKIKIGVMADLALMVQYNYNCLFAGAGWNFWARSREEFVCEDVCEKKCCPFSGNNKYAIKGNTLANNTETQSLSTIGTCAPTDLTPIFLTDNDIDRSVALNPRAFSNKFFGFVGRNWHGWKCDYFTPFVLLEGEVEVGHCNTAVNQWSLMVKGGVDF